MTNAVQTEPVDRGRRSKFIFCVVAFCLLSAAGLTLAAGLGFITVQIALVTTFVEAVIGLAVAATLAYITGSSVDYNGGVAKMFGKDK